MGEYININQLRHHPNNPRKDIGDITELADSIKQQGLICPLLVIPHGDDEYFVIAGNRRLEACKAAGLDAVYCEVANMDDETAVGIMLTENILRQNLNTAEEADGFQLMLDMGKDEDTIAKETGFKKETVRLRTKLKNLDKDNLLKACDAGATIFELAAVADIEDEKERNKLLKKAGTKDFNNAMLRMKEEKQSAQYMLEVEEFCRDHEFVEYTESSYQGGFPCLSMKDEDGNIIAQRAYMKCVQTFRPWDKELPKEEFIKPNTYYAFTKNKYSISIFTDVPGDEISEYNARIEQGKLEAEKDAELEHQMNEINNRHRALREDFVLNFTNFKKKQKELKALYLSALVSSFGISSWAKDQYMLRYTDLLDKCPDTSTDVPDKALLLMSFVFLDREDYVCRTWNSDAKAYVIAKNPGINLDVLYSHLEALGYKLSTEEEEIRASTHAIFGNPEEEPEEDVAIA